MAFANLVGIRPFRDPFGLLVAFASKEGIRPFRNPFGSILAFASLRGAFAPVQLVLNKPALSALVCYFAA